MNSAADSPAKRPGETACAALTWIAFLLAVCALVYVLCLNARVIYLPAPLEYRQPAILISTDLIAHGQNPWSVQNQPMYTNVYGFAYHVLMAPLARLFGCTFLIHRIVSAIFTFARLALLFIAARDFGVSGKLAFVAATLLYCDVAGRWANLPLPAMPQTILARPDAMALALFIASIAWPLRSKFSTRSLIASALLGALAMCTKPYLMLGPPLVAAYLFLFRDKARGLIFGIATLALFAATMIAATIVMPCYYADVVTGTGNAAHNSIPAHLYSQLKTYAVNSPGLVALALTAVASGSVGIARQLKSRSEWFNARNARQPLLRLDISFPAFATCCCFVLLYAKLGRYGGNSMVYFYHLLSPVLILAVVIFIAKAPGHRRWPLLVLLIVNLLVFPFSAAPFPSAHADVYGEWEALFARHHNIYAPPALAHFLLFQHKPIYDGGMSYSFQYSLDNPIYPSEKVLRQRYEQFEADLARQVETKQLDLIVLPYLDGKPELTFLPADLLQRNYRAIGTMDIPLDWSPGWTGVILEPAP